jgi:fatty acid desaturase
LIAAFSNLVSRQRLSLWYSGKRSVAAAPLATRVLLNFNFHGIHHQNPAIPWIRLPVVFREQSQIFHGHYLLAAMRQLRGPVATQDLPPATSHRGSARGRISHSFQG